MSKYEYGCRVICNANDVYPAMQDLVENEGLSAYDAAKFIEGDSKGEVSKDRAYKVFSRRSDEGKTMSRDMIVDFKRRKTVKVDRFSNDLKGFIAWNKATGKCLKFASDILRKKVSWNTDEEEVVVKKCFRLIDRFFEVHRKGGDSMPKKDESGPPKGSGGRRDGSGKGGGRATGSGSGSKSGGKKGKC